MYGKEHCEIALAIDALEKQIPKKQVNVYAKYIPDKLTGFKCPTCGSEITGTGYYCWNCGQHIKWDFGKEIKSVLYDEL